MAITQIRLAQLTGSLGTSSGQVSDQVSAAATGSIGASDLSSVLSHMASAIKRIHGSDSFSEAAAGTFSQSLVPDSDGGQNLGSTSVEWSEVHANSLISQAAMVVSASNANLTVKGLALDIAADSTFDLDAAGAITIDGASLAIGGDSDTGAITVDSTAGVSIDGAAASNFSTSAGDLTLDAAAGSLNLTGGEADAAAVRIQADNASGGIDIDAGTAGIAIDSTGALSMDAVGASNLTTDSGNLTLSATTSGNVVVTSAAGSVDINSSLAMTLDSTAGGLSLDGVDDSNFTVTGSGKDLNLGVSGGGAQVLKLDSAGSGTDAIDINATGGGIDIDAAGAVAIDAASASNMTVAGANLTLSTTTSGNVIANAAGDVDVDGANVYLDASSAVSIDAGAASNLSTSAGDLTLEAGASDAQVVIKGDHESGTAIHLDGNAASASVVDIDAGILDIDATGAANIDAGGALSLDAGAASNFTTSAGDLSVLASAAKVILSGSSAADSVHVQSEATFAAAVVMDGALTVGGNLTVSGTTTTVDSTVLTVADPLIKLNKGDTTSPARDQGIVFSRGDGSSADQANYALLWDESADQFAFVASATEDATTSGDVTIDSYADLQVGALTATSIDLGLNQNEVVFPDANGVLSGSADFSFDGSDVKIAANIGLTFDTNGSEKIESDDTDLTVSSGGKINLTATSDVVIPANVGLILDGSGDEKIESDGTDISFSVGSGGDINVPASIGMTFGDDGEKIEGDGTDLFINSSARLLLSASTDVHIPQGIGLSFSADSAEKIESDGTDLTVASGGILNLDVAAAIKLDSDSGDVSFEDGGVAQLAIDMDGTSGQIDIQLKVDSDDLVFKQYDGNEVVRITDDRLLKFYDDGSEYISGDGDDLKFNSGRDFVFSAGSGGAVIPGSDGQGGYSGYDLGQPSAGSLTYAYPSQYSSPYGISDASDGTTVGTLTSSTSVVYLSTSSISASFFSALSSGSTLVVDQWSGTVSSVGSANGDGYRAVNISSASGSQSLSSVSTIEARSSDYAAQRWWKDVYASSATLGAGATNSTAMTLSGSIIPSFGSSATAATYDLGSSTYKFRTLYAGSNGSSAVIASGSMSPELDDSFDIGGIGAFSTSPSISVDGSQTVTTSTTSLSVSSLSSDAADALTVGAQLKLSGGGYEWVGTIGAAASSGDTSLTISSATLSGGASANTSDMYESPQIAKFNEWRNLYVDGVSYLDEVQLDDISEPSDVSNKLYSVSSILHWNGAPLGVPVIYRHTMSASDIVSSSQTYTMVSGDRTGDSDVTFSSSTVLNKVQVYLNGQLQYVTTDSSGDVDLTSTSLQLDFLASGALQEDDVIQVIVYA